MACTGSQLTGNRTGPGRRSDSTFAALPTAWDTGGVGLVQEGIGEGPQGPESYLLSSFATHEHGAHQSPIA